jgi:hypothetical protein
MWKFVRVLLKTEIAILIAQLVADAPVIQTRVGTLYPVQITHAFAGVRGGSRRMSSRRKPDPLFVCASRTGFRLAPE